MMSRDH